MTQDVGGRGLLGGRAAQWACAMVTPGYLSYHILLRPTCPIGATGFHPYGN